MPFPLTPEQRAAVEDRGGTLLVSAAAGSGKTRVLVERLMDYVSQGHDIDEFLVITFTNAAAAELRGRIAGALSGHLALEPRNGHLRKQTTLVYKAKICTIDAFCVDLLRECGHLAGVDADFRICDEAEGAARRAAALETVLEERYSHMEDYPGFRDLAEALAGDRDDQTLADAVLDIHARIQAHPDPMGWLEERRGDFDLPPTAKPEDTAWGRLLLEDAARTAAYWANALEEAGRLAAGDDVVFANYGPGLELAASDLLAFAASCRMGWDSAAACDVRFPKAGAKRNGDIVLRDRVKAVWNGCKKQVSALLDRFSLPTQAVLEDLRAVGAPMSALLETVAAFDTAYKAEKGHRLLDFADAEHLAVSLLVGEDGAPTPLALEWRERFTEIMVDEYQDTNAAQNALFDALSKNGRNLFLVGDVKQSIYRFRLADPTIFLAKYDAFPPAAEAGEGQPRKLTLSRNFRSRPEVLSGVNYLFRGILSRQFGEIDYDDDQALFPGGPDVGFDPACAVELNALDLASLGTEADDEEEGTSKDLAEARAVAKRLRELHDSGFSVDGENGPRHVAWEDMAVLLRAIDPLLHLYAAAFAEQGIPWTSDKGENPFDTTEVHTALGYLQIVDNPRQDVALLAVLRSPVWGFTPDRLAYLRAGGSGDLYDALLAGEGRGEADCAAFLTELRTLRAQAGERSSHRFLWYLYERTGMLGIFGAMEGGERRRENLLALYDCAQRFEAGGHKGLFGFLSHMARVLENGVKLDHPRQEGRPGLGGGGVRLMSIHRSKGLEFPVVLVPGLGRKFHDKDLQKPILFHTGLGLGPKRVDRTRMLRSPTLARDALTLALKRENRAEELRLLYVAMTRAQKKLILFTTLNGRMDKVVRLAEDAAYPVPPPMLFAGSSVGVWVLLAALCRPDAGALHDLAGRTPAAFAARTGYPWDIRTLSAGDYEKPPDRARKPAAEAGAEVPQADMSALVPRFAWVYPHADQVGLPSKLTATQLKGRVRDQEAAEGAGRQWRPSNTDRAEGETAQPVVRRPLTRPRFAAEERGLTPAQRGTALHLVMQLADPDRAATPAGARAEAERLVQGGWLTPQQGESVNTAWVSHFWSSPLGQEARSAVRMEREFKFSLLVPASRYFPQGSEGEEVLLQGVVDCWFQNPDGTVTVVDFKTDAVTEDRLAERAESYRPQLEAYAGVLAQVLGAEVSRRSLWFFRLGRAAEI